MFGIPNLLRPPSAGAVVTAILGRAAGAAWNYLFPGPAWGVYTAGTTTPAVDVSSVVALGLRKSSNVSDYKIETGSFVSYNKVETPRIVQIRITREGSELERAVLLNWLETQVKAPTLFDIVMPELRYANMTLIDFAVDRTATASLGMLVVDCGFQEIRQLEAAYSGGNVSGAENAPTVPARRVQASPSSYGGGFTE